MRIFLFIAAIHFSVTVRAQSICATLGQNPSTAFPVCGTSVFTQNTVPLCGGRRLPSPACSINQVTDINPFWYKFTCFQTGTLGFEITPKNIADDYDWELYDITNRNPNEIYTNGNLVVASNWSGEGGVTGASGSGSQLFVCAGLGRPVFSRMPTLQAGRNYLLLVSHFTQSQSGYDLAFRGGTAVITDAIPPRMIAAEASCGGDVIRVKLNKNIKCNSIAVNGSDFFITPAIANVVNSIGINCSAKFDTDSLDLKLDQFLPPGNYTLNIKRGSDGNTLLDFCDNGIAIGDQINFTVFPVAPTPFDGLVPPQCAPSSLTLVFRKPILCSSIAADGSDFMINGSYAVGISGARGSNCSSSSTTREIIVSLNQPLEQAGDFQIQLQTGSDGNTIIDECGQETPGGGMLPFSVKDTVNADFTYSIEYGCTVDVVDFSHPARNGVNMWQWNLDDNMQSNQQNPQARYSIFNQKNITLTVSNGFCTATKQQPVLLENFLKADFTVYEDNCPDEPVLFTTNSVGKIVQYNWQFGDGGTGSGITTTHIYAKPFSIRTYNVTHTVTDSYGCSRTTTRPIKVYTSCIIAVPSAFTPNGDGKNDFFYPLNAVKAEKLEFRVYNRWGQQLFFTTNWKQSWNGVYKGSLQPAGVYIWTLKYINRDTRQLVEKKGTVVLIR